MSIQPSCIPPSVLKSLTAELCTTTHEQSRISDWCPVSGGDINQAYKFQFGSSHYFCKFNRHPPDQFFHAEALGLALLRQVNTLRIPDVILFGESDGFQFLVLEMLDVGYNGDHSLLGKKLAILHKHSITDNPAPGRHGLPFNNYIGTTPQTNTQNASWCEFWSENRIRPQLRMAQSKGFLHRANRLEHRFFRGIENLLEHYNPPPSLLHGDLWSGNKDFDRHGSPVLYDPAVYFGDRETDIALTELFGGFSPSFYQGYNAEWPLDAGYSDRKDLYNLYHLLNHLNLFGESYLSSCMRVIKHIATTYA